MLPAAATFRPVRIAVLVAQRRAIAVVHGSRIHAAERFVLARPSAGLVSAGTLLAEAATAVFWLALPRAMSMRLAVRLSLTLRLALAL